MRTIERSSAFKRDYRRFVASPRHRADLGEILATIVTRLADDAPLPERNRDHPLGGQWEGYRECHLKPDLLLVYSKPDASVLRLARLGTHADLFG